MERRSSMTTATPRSDDGGDGGGAAGGYGIGALELNDAWPKGGNGWKGYHYENAELDGPSTPVGTSSSRSGRPPSSQPCKIDAVEQPFINLWAATRYWFISDNIPQFLSTPARAWAATTRRLKPWFASRNIRHTVVTQRSSQGAGPPVPPLCCVFRNQARSTSGHLSSADFLITMPYFFGIHDPRLPLARLAHRLRVHPA